MIYCFVSVCFSEFNTLKIVILFETKVQLSAHINKKNLILLKKISKYLCHFELFAILINYLGLSLRMQIRQRWER